MLIIILDKLNPKISTSSDKTLKSLSWIKKEVRYKKTGKSGLASLFYIFKK